MLKEMEGTQVAHLPSTMKKSAGAANPLHVPENHKEIGFKPLSCKFQPGRKLLALQTLSLSFDLNHSHAYSKFLPCALEGCLAFQI
jgi:hypothetical protein